MTLRERIEAAHYGDAPLPVGIGPLLSALSLGQRAGMALRGLKTPVRVEARVVSFGNLTAGGTGKTPAVIERAAREVNAGNRVAVITRGYGSAPTPEPTVLPPNADPADAFAMVGDEAALIHRRVPGVWIVKSAHRVAGAREAIARGCSVLLLDDGFQSLALVRDEDIVLVDAAHPYGNGHLLPRGPLREYPNALARATEVWLTRCDRATTLEQTVALVEKHHGKPPTRLTCHAPTRLWRLSDGTEEDLGLLKNRDVTLACAIARPAEFERTVTQLGARITARQFHPDHQRFDAATLPAEGLVITTEKDAVRLDSARPNVYALAMELRDWIG